MGLKEKIGIERALSKLAAFQCRHYKKVIVMSLLITVILGYGATGLQFQGDVAKEMPQDLPVFALQEMIESEFKGEEFMIIAVCLDRETGAKDIPRDVRDPKVIASVVELHERLEAESSIEKVQSVATHFQHGVPEDMVGVKKKLASVNNSGRFFNDDFSIMLVYASPTAGLSEEKVKAVTDMIQKDVDTITKPAGVEYKITGMAPLINELIRLMREDMFFTTIVAAIIIFMLLALLERSLTKGFLVFLPLIFAIIWTFGTMGLLGIPISLSTVIVGAVIIGLGVEYGIFMVSRYYEERERHASAESLKIAITNIGSSTFGSAATTAAAFFALTLSAMPMIQHLGQTLALGIIYCWIAAAIVNPCFIVFEERIEAKKIAGLLQKWIRNER
uniref:Exporter of the RND superfamily n=1 Tax=Uncultured archaeon GZfos26G2 TaxID=3386331 RepID=Q64B14_UNCAG|nr:exporter of the RND superfamily [uncultured archaeon GZfos28B8]